LLFVSSPRVEFTHSLFGLQVPIRLRQLCLLKAAEYCFYVGTVAAKVKADTIAQMAAREAAAKETMSAPADQTDSAAAPSSSALNSEIKALSETVSISTLPAAVVTESDAVTALATAVSTISTATADDVIAAADLIYRQPIEGPQRPCLLKVQ
jgi:hypothetical protein